MNQTSCVSECVEADPSKHHNTKHYTLEITRMKRGVGLIKIFALLKIH